MPKTHLGYPPELRCRLVELVRAGRDPADLAPEFGSSPQGIRKWARQAERDARHRTDGMTMDEREPTRCGIGPHFSRPSMGLAA